ncbi:MAG: GNAT family N-acetyltransferase [Aureispira sp.]|nr:GNAT family N-acetyltransferase [Aureispira sp.]
MNSSELVLRKTITTDLDTLFNNQLDEESNYMAAFTAKDPTDKDAYMAKWTKIVVNDAVNMQTILLEDKIVGSILHFDAGEETFVAYGIGKDFWGKGIASAALAKFLKLSPKRPLFAQTVFDNLGSQRVLEKNGFVVIGKEINFANARGKEVEEFVFKLS